MHSVSIVVPVYNDAENLRACLAALRAADPRAECIVVDDGSTDDSPAVAERYGAAVVRTGGRRGPAHARNLGAASAHGDVLLFIDADVRVHADVIDRVAAAFEADPALDAVIGSYDDAPASRNFLSQYKNLMHCFVHQRGREEACTFWSGCGAIRRDVFLAHTGFDEGYGRPAIEDIELGYRLRRAGRKLALDRGLQVTHLKRWTFWGLLRSDIFDRGIPWTELILRDRDMPNDLNLRWGQRASVVLTYLIAASLLLPAVWAFASIAAAGAVLLALNADFYRFLARRRGVPFTIAAIPVHWLYHFYNGISFTVGAIRHAARAMLILLLVSPALVADDWQEFRSGPFTIFSTAGEKPAREVLNELEQIRHVLGALVGKPDLKSVWPIRVIVIKKGAVHSEPKLARDAIVASLVTVQPETRRRLVELLLDSNIGRLPGNLERGLISLFSTFEANGTRLTLGIPPAQRDRDWSRMHMLAVDPRFSGKLRVLLSNLQQGVDADAAWRNAFEMSQEQIERELDKYIEAGGYETGSPSARPVNAQRQFYAREADPKIVELTLLDVAAANGDAAAKEKLAQIEGALDAPVPLLARAKTEKDRLKARALREKAAQLNPLWAEPWWVEAETEENPIRKVQLLKKAADLAPRRTEYWLALARAQEANEQFADAVKSWAAAERSADTNEQKARLQQARLAGEEQRREKLRLEKEEERRKAQAELQALKQRALENIRAAEARANAGNEPLDPKVKLEEWRENLGYDKAVGRLDRVECMGRQARLHVTTESGTLRLLVRDPAKVVIRGGGERSLGCGVQKPARLVNVDYVVKADGKLGTAGDVTTVEFR